MCVGQPIHIHWQQMKHADTTGVSVASKAKARQDSGCYRGLAQAANCLLTHQAGQRGQLDARAHVQDLQAAEVAEGLGQCRQPLAPAAAKL
jgi:hypothetical protein